MAGQVATGTAAAATLKSLYSSGEEAMKKAPGRERARRMRASLSNVLSALAGDRPHYEESTRALFAGDLERLEKLVARGGDPTRVASVASFFISRIDSAIDALVAEIEGAGGHAAAHAVTSSPIATVPPERFPVPCNDHKRLDLPEPLRPMSAMRSQRPAARSTPLTARTPPG